MVMECFMTDKQWATGKGEAGRDTHVWPLNDLRKHDLTKDCWCDPRKDYEEFDLYIHRSMDKRESYEQGRKMS